MAGSDQITGVIQQHVVPLVFSGLNYKWYATCYVRNWNPKVLTLTLVSLLPQDAPIGSHTQRSQWYSRGGYRKHNSRSVCVIVCVCECVCFLPDKISAMWAVGWLSQVGGHELVSIDLMDTSSDGALSSPGTDPLSEHSLLIFIGTRGCGANRREKIINKNVKAFVPFRWHIHPPRMFSYGHRFYFLYK